LFFDSRSQGRGYCSSLSPPSLYFDLQYEMNINPDTRPLPLGWTSYYDPQANIWMYINQTVTPHYVTSIHPGATEGRGHHNPRIEPSGNSQTVSAVDPGSAQYYVPPNTAPPRPPTFADPTHTRPQAGGTQYYHPPYSAAAPSAVPAVAPSHRSYSTETPYSSQSSYPTTRQQFGQAQERYQYSSAQQQPFSAYQDTQSYPQSSYGPTSTAYTPQQQQTYHPPASTYQPPAARYQSGVGGANPGGDSLPPQHPPPPANPQPHHTTRGPYDYPEYRGSGGGYYS